MGQKLKIEAVDVAQEPDESAPSRRHRPASELRVAGTAPSTSDVALPSERGVFAAPFMATGALTDELRAALWEVVLASLFAPSEELDRWTGGVTSRPAVRRVWTAAPLGGDLDRIPEDVVDVLEGWFSLVEPSDVYTFIESVHDNLETPFQTRFAATVNGALERGLSDHRFVLRKLMPVAAKADIAAIERGLATSKAARWMDVETHLLAAIAKLALKPDPDATGTIQDAVRAVELAAFALTAETYSSLDDALEDLQAKGHIAKALKAAYSGLFGYVITGVRKATTDDARLILVMCAGFVSHLTTRIG